MRLILAFLILLPGLAASYPTHHWAGVVQVSYIEGRHLELVRTCPDSWVLRATDPQLEAKLESAIGRHAIVWGSEVLEPTIWNKNTILVDGVWVNGVWVRGEPIPQGLPPPYPCP